MEDEPAAPQVRRLLGRTLRLGPARALIAGGRAPHSRWVAILLAAGLLVRLGTLTLPGTEDVQVWKTWSYAATTDLTAMYGVGGSPPERGVVTWGTRQTTVDYPPATLYGLALVGFAYGGLDARFGDTPLLTAAIKLAILVMDGLLCYAVWLLARKLGGPGAANLAAAWYWCNPAILLDGAVLGYLDTWAGALAMLALACAAAEAAAACGALVALACLTKLQAVFVAPAAALLLCRASRSNVRQLAIAGAGAACVTAAVLAPFAIRGALPNVRQGVASLLRHDMLSGTAANLWWIVTWLLRASYAVKDAGAWAAWTMTVRILGVSRVVALGYPNPRPIGAVLALGAIAWALWRAHRSGSAAAIVAAGAFTVHAYFTLAVQVHENHLFLALPMLAIAAPLLTRMRGPFIALGAVFAANLYLFYGIGRGYPLPPRNFTVIDATVLLSFANLAVMGWFAVALHHATDPAAIDGNGDAGHV